MIIVNYGTVLVPGDVELPEKLKPLFQCNETGQWKAFFSSPQLAYFMAYEMHQETGINWEVRQVEDILNTFRKEDAPWPTNPNVLILAYHYVYNRQNLVTDSAELMYKISHSLR